MLGQSREFEEHKLHPVDLIKKDGGGSKERAPSRAAPLQLSWRRPTGSKENVQTCPVPQIYGEGWERHKGSWPVESNQKR